METTSEVSSLMADARLLGYRDGGVTRQGHIILVHSKTGRSVPVSPRAASRGLKKIRGKLQRCARREAPGATH